MLTLLIVIHVIVCLFLIIVVLLQHGKGADIGATFGGSSQTLFGSEGPLPLLNKITTAAAIVFMCTSMGLAYYATHTGTESVMKDMAQPPAQTGTTQPAVRTDTAAPAEKKAQAPETVPAAAKHTETTPIAPAGEKHDAVKAAPAKKK